MDHPEQINDILEAARERGRHDALIGWDKADVEAWVEFEEQALVRLGISADTMDSLPMEEFRALSRLATQSTAIAYWDGWKHGYQERGGGRAMTDLAVVTHVAYDTLVKAAREGRLEAWKSGGTWLSTMTAVQDAIAKGHIRPRYK